MTLKRLALAAGLVVAAHAAHAQGFSDNELSYRFQPLSHEPGVDKLSNPKDGVDIQKNIVNLTHVDGGNLIANFISIDFLKSDGEDPANNSTDGAMEVYAVYRGNIGSKSIFGDTISFGPIRDVTFEFGGDANTKNTAFAPQKDSLVVGPNFHFDTAGFLNLGIHLYKEWNNNGIVDKAVSFNPTGEFELAYMQPLTFTGLPLRFEGFTNLVLPKGRDGFENETRTELLFHSQLTLDVGDLVLHKPHVLDGFVGFQYWVNKFGNDHNVDGGALEATPFFGVGVHF